MDGWLDGWKEEWHSVAIAYGLFGVSECVCPCVLVCVRALCVRKQIICSVLSTPYQYSRYICSCSLHGCRANKYIHRHPNAGPCEKVEKKKIETISVSSERVSGKKMVACKSKCIGSCWATKKKFQLIFHSENWKKKKKINKIVIFSFYSRFHSSERVNVCVQVKTGAKKVFLFVAVEQKCGTISANKLRNLSRWHRQYQR